MSNNMFSLSVSDTENITNDEEEVKSTKKTTKRIYKKKNIFNEKEMDQLTFLSKLEKFEEDINNQFEIIKRLKQFTKDIRQSYQQDIIKIRKMKRQKENSNITGFNKKISLPDKFTELIGVDKNTEMSIPELTSKIYQELKKRNLQYENDKRIYRVDKQFMDVLSIKDTVNKSTNYPDENGFNIGTMQTYINNALKNQNNNIEPKIKVTKKIYKSII